jgi:hypothetical protein
MITATEEDRAVIDSMRPGQIVYLRHWQRDQPSQAGPFHVAEARTDGVLLWAPADTTYWNFDMPDGRTMDRTPLREWTATPRVPVVKTVRHALLSWHPTGCDYSVRLFFRPDGEFYAWYANLELPAVAWHQDGLTGLDTVDWDLDVWVHPDRRWQWKDEELFAARLAEPDVYWVDDPDRVRRAGRDIVELVEAGAFPFDGTWVDFRPDPAWPAPPPGLPTGLAGVPRQC